MTKTADSTRLIAPGYEPFSGYVLEEKIGEGGFGEVWRADAPGGIKKAVKFVFGATDENRGSRELKSLERIKGVHHPFLLTLDRFGIVNDQLVIVTELADGSLEEVFKRHCDRGSCGIPRKALLAYLHDAADALDYLHSKYQLQHLDIKPGNLLLVGGHVKVADFGLLKDLREADCSIVGGLTPTYAPPEVFDGRPSLHSDQYSLGVMYQEMLTGARPFNGRTIAQLATQHVHGSPNLNALPACDQPIVARALEKDPTRRFDSCADFVDALRHVQSRSATASGMPTKGSSAQTDPLSFGQNQPASVQDLPQLDSKARSISGRITSHTLVVALGGTGASCLHDLRSRIAKLYSASPMDLHSVLIDTDAATIQATKLAEISDLIPQCHLVHTPLKSAMDYRREQHQRFGSISRRWIYNVPRNGRTEGMRPLGRLALVDHGETIRRTLVEAIDHLAAVCGERIPMVYVIGSVSGGTGGGMYLDVVHLLRNLLDQAGLENSKIVSLLSAAAMRGNPANPLLLHDTQATLQEMQHFMKPGNSYPGDAGAGFESLPAARSPLSDAYVITGPADEAEGIDPRETIVNYLWAAANGAHDLLEAARRGTEDATAGMPATLLRSVGAVRLGTVRALEEKLLAPALIRHLLLSWLGRPGEAKQLAKPVIDRLIKRSEMTREAIRNAMLGMYRADDDSRREWLMSLIRRLPEEALQSDQAIRNFLEPSIADATISNAVSRLVASYVVAISREFIVRLHDRRLDITSAIEVTARLIDRCNELSTTNSADHLMQSSADAMDVGLSGDDPITERVNMACEIGRQIMSTKAESLTNQFFVELAKQLQTMRARLEGRAVLIAEGIQATSTDGKADANAWSEMPRELQVRFEPLLAELHESMVDQTLLAMLRSNQPGMNADTLVSKLSDAALPLVKNAVDATESTAKEEPLSPALSTTTPATLALSQTNRLQDEDALGDSDLVSPTRTASFTAQQSNVSHDAQVRPETMVAKVRPGLLDCGGMQRLMLLVGSDAELQQLETRVKQAHDGSLTSVIIPGITPMLIHEAQQVPMQRVLERLEVAAGDPSVSNRLRSRADVDWSN
ncbi:protein kinase domain-containing protein [Crateriforma spongiae]|uniref:protein kinase domain-containing protein n=1 Tax=Crateriforma spongiae TaxID=2724528 RepID=UPI001447E8DE|nr:protein kinase [Crateriforma spongiae]